MAEPSRPQQARDPSPPKPMRIGRYEVDRLLGQGGMGRVWLARDTVLERRVAIKVLRDDLALPPSVREELVERMRHEARAAAAVSHPNIVTLHDMGEDRSLGLFLVFEYVTARAGSEPEGEMPLTLRDRLKRGPLPLAEVAQLARELGSALTFAHETGVIHRDVKPENVLFSRTGFKIADFGIARIPESTITRANTVLGTPAYTAPEALSKGEFGPASDQFALAATLYEAATGARAFQGDDAIATAGKVSSEPPPPLLPSIGPDAVVRALETTLAKGLAKAPEDRFPSCFELGQEVARVIETEGAPPRRKSLFPPPPLLQVERTPLSSRAAMVDRSMTEGGPVATESSRPSIYMRKRTHRFQNIAAGIALLVIIALVVIGRRSPAPIAEDLQEVPSSATAPSAGAPRPPPKPAARPSSSRPATSAYASARPAEDAAAAPADAAASE